MLRGRRWIGALLVGALALLGCRGAAPVGEPVVLVTPAPATEAPDKCQRRVAPAGTCLILILDACDRVLLHNGELKSVLCLLSHHTHS